MRDIFGNEANARPDFQNEEEIWKDIKDYPGYRVSSFGNIIGKRGRLLKPKVDKNGYYIVGLSEGQKKKYARVARLVGEAFCEGQSEEKNIIDHIDHCRINNYYKNLRWVSPRESVKNRKPYAKKNYSVKKKTPILCLDKDNNIIGSYSCVKEASEIAGYSYYQIACNLNGTRKPFKNGIYFMRKEDYMKMKNVS